MLAVASRDGILVPRVIAAGDQAERLFLEFFAATIRNKNTRMAYYRAAVLRLARLAGDGPGRRHQSARSVRGPKHIVKTAKTRC